MNKLILILTISITFIGCRNKKFDPEIWKENHEEQFWMLSNLIESEILIGNSKDDVIEILDTIDIKEFRYADDNWIYTISKPENTLSTQNPVEVLDITFKNDRVIKAERRE